MAHIFKYPKKDSKGVIVFTHKEWPWLLQNAQSTLLDLRQHFLLGWNQGTYFGNIQMPEIVDFAFTSPNCLTFPDNGNTQNIELLDRNFINSDFTDLGISDRHFDFICVARSIKLKNIPSFLQALRESYDKGNMYKALLVIPTAENETPEKYDTDIVEQFTNLFNYEERKNITMLRLSSELGFMGISPQTLNWLYNNSKVLYIGSDSEGGCRVVHEALLAGCDIVYWNHHRGALKDYLNDKNSMPFESYNDIESCLSESIENWNYYDGKGSEYNRLLSETYALEKLKPHFDKLYNNHNQTFDGELLNCDNLASRLPAHYLDVPWNHPTDPTADIKTIEQLSIFVNYLNKNII